MYKKTQYKEEIKYLWITVIIIGLTLTLECFARPDVIARIEKEHQQDMNNLTKKLNDSVNTQNDLYARYKELKNSIMPACFKGVVKVKL